MHAPHMMVYICSAENLGDLFVNMNYICLRIQTKRLT